MTAATLTIDLGNIVRNWQALDIMSRPFVKTAAVVKADAYGLGMAPVAKALHDAGVTQFFVAIAEEGTALRATLGTGPEINVFSGHMAGDSYLIRDHALTPMLNSPEQIARHQRTLPGHAFGVQLNCRMNRLGLQPQDWLDLRGALLADQPTLIMSHLACAEEPDNPMNARQLADFNTLTDGLPVKRSLAATAGILLGPDYHFDLTRPGIGLHGGSPFMNAKPVVSVNVPVIQCRKLAAGETVGYGNSWCAQTSMQVATISAGYADGVIRALGANLRLFHQGHPCPALGRISMDLITVDITHLDDTPDQLELLGPDQTVDDLARAGETIGHEILTSLGARYRRLYKGLI